MNEHKNKKISLKNASATARKIIKRIAKSKRLKDIILSLVILAVGIALGLVFNEFELFLAIATALDIVIFIISEDNKI